MTVSWAYGVKVSIDTLRKDKMKRYLLIFLILAAAGGTAFSQQVRLTGQWAMQDGQSSVISSAKDGAADHLGGLGAEIVFHHLGFGTSVMAYFQEEDPDQWLVDWDLRTYMSYHFFGSRSFLDPFMQAGIGAAGEVGISGSVCNESNYTEVNRVAIAVYPYIGGGVGLHFRGGMYMSGQFNWRPVAGQLPCTTIDYPDFNEFEVVLALGVALGGRR